MREEVLKKLQILAESAKYDVSCASSGVGRSHRKGAVGSAAGWGICHSFAEDGRCISLLKIMLTNYCMFDCAYCINRVSNDIPRATLSVSELVELTMEFYRRNYIEGLFLSSGVVRSADYTMERLVRVVKDLRTVHRFNGYIHLKSIPGASQELVNEAGRYADRMSVNIEIPNEQSLKRLAPDKDFQSVFTPMRYIQQGALQAAEEPSPFVGSLSTSHHEARLLFGIYPCEYLRYPPSSLAQGAFGAREPSLSGGLAIALLSV